MKNIKAQVTLAASLVVAAMAPGLASASYLLDTGTPAGASTVVLNSSNFYAAEFSATAGKTIDQLSAYLVQNVGGVGSTFTWDIYSTATNFLGVGRASPVFSATATFGGNGWNTSDVSWTPTTTGNYWVALQVAPTGQTHGLGLPTEASATTGTAPAQAFAFAGTNNRYALETNTAVGVRVSAVPLPAAVVLLGSGLLGFAPFARRRRS